MEPTKESLEEQSGYWLDLKKPAIKARYTAMYEALTEYLARHSPELSKRYEKDGKPGAALPEAPSERYGQRPEPWQGQEFQPVLLFSTNSVKLSSRSAQQMVISEKGLAHDEKYHEQARQDYHDKRWRSQTQERQQQSTYTGLSLIHI